MALAVERWEIEARLGGAWNLPLPLRVEQDGQETIRFTAHWNSESLEQPLYYGLRASTWSGDRAWALDLTHHKIHLADPPPEIGNFAVSHGYNLVTLLRLAERDGWRYGGGAGVVVAHPENEVRGRRLDEHRGILGSGYYVAGPTAGAQGARSVALDGGFFVTAEARLTFSYAFVPVTDGSARVPNLALHGTIGIGWGSDR
jgi:hypothetical protein